MTPRQAAEARSDGCTAAPDLHILACCIQHDADYTTRADEHGAPLTRAQADARLHACIINQSPRHPIAAHLLAAIYYLAVRIFGRRYWSKTQAETEQPPAP